MNMKMNKKMIDSKGGNATFLSESPLIPLTFLLTCGLGLAFANHICSLNLITHPSQTLLLISVFLAPLVIILYSHLRHDRSQCSYLKAVGRGFLALPAGAVINAVGATILGAPVGFEYFPKTLNWSLLMSTLTFVPGACVFGSSWTDWHRIFARTEANESTDCMICLPAHGAVIGAWFGAWPMPLDWESPWQVLEVEGKILFYILVMLLVERSHFPILQTSARGWENVLASGLFSLTGNLVFACRNGLFV